MSISVCRGLNDDVISLCFYSDGLLQPKDLQLGAPASIFCRILALAASLFLIFHDLLFTVVIN